MVTAYGLVGGVGRLISHVTPSAPSPSPESGVEFRFRFRVPTSPKVTWPYLSPFP